MNVQHFQSLVFHRSVPFSSQGMMPFILEKVRMQPEMVLAVLIQ